MRRKLLILDVALIAAAIYAGVRVRGQWQAAKERENAVLSRRVAPAAPLQLAALPPVPPVLPVEYADIAQKMLLDKSRNSTVVIETPPAPPPVPVPPLPFYHGQMRLPGEGPIVILSETARAAHQAVHPGETIAGQDHPQEPGRIGRPWRRLRASPARRRAGRLAAAQVPNGPRQGIDSRGQGLRRQR